MNHAIFAAWLIDKTDELVGFGVPRDEAERLMVSLEVGAIAAEASERNDSQFLLDLRAVGTSGMANRKRCSAEAIRAKRRKIIHKRTARQGLCSMA